METRPPTPMQLLVAVAFALSCFGLLLFLWLVVRRPDPAEARELPVQRPVRRGDAAPRRGGRADLRRLGGQGEGGRPRRRRRRAEATIEIDASYAPVASNTRAILRQKTLLGETYVELTPGSPDASPVPRPAARGRTRCRRPGLRRRAARRDLPRLRRAAPEAFQVWHAGGVARLARPRRGLHAALGNLGPFAAEAEPRPSRPRQPARSNPATCPRHRRGLRGAQRAPRPAGRGRSRTRSGSSTTTAARDESLQPTFEALPDLPRPSRG